MDMTFKQFLYNFEESNGHHPNWGGARKHHTHRTQIKKMIPKTINMNPKVRSPRKEVKNHISKLFKF